MTTTFRRARSGLYIPRSGGGAGGAAAYKAAILADSPVLFWEFNETSGTIAADSSGNSHTGTYTNATLAQASLFSDGAGNSVSHNGTNAYTHISGASWMGTPGSITAEARVKWDGNQQFVAGRWGGIGQTGWLLYITTAGKLTAQVDGGAALVSGATTLASGTIYTVALRCNGTTVQVFVNGVSDGSVNHAAPTQVYDLELARASAATFTTLRIDGFSLFTTALSDTRMAAHHAAT